MLPAPTAPSEGSAGVRNLVDKTRRLTNPLSILAHQLRRRFPSNRSLLRGAKPTYSSSDPEDHRSFDPFGLPRTEALSQNRPMFHGPSWVDHSCVSLCPSARGLPNRVALEEDQLFRRLFPTGATNLRRVSHCLSAEIGPSVTLRSLLSLAGLPVEAGTSVPITHVTWRTFSSRESEKIESLPVDNGDIVHNSSQSKRLPLPVADSFRHA